MGDDETTDQARQRELEPAIEAALSERERTGYPRPEKQSVRGEAGTVAPARSSSTATVSLSRNATPAS